MRLCALPLGSRGRSSFCHLPEGLLQYGVKSGAGLQAFVPLGQRLRFCIRSHKGRPSPHVSSRLAVVEIDDLGSRLSSSWDCGIVGVSRGAGLAAVSPVAPAPPGSSLDNFPLLSSLLLNAFCQRLCRCVTVSVSEAKPCYGLLRSVRRFRLCVFAVHLYFPWTLLGLTSARGYAIVRVEGPGAPLKESSASLVAASNGSFWPFLCQSSV